MVSILIMGGVSIIVLCPWLLNLIGSETKMPSSLLMSMFLVYMLIRTNAEIFAMMMTSRNVIPYPSAVLITAAAQLLFTVALLKFTTMGIWALFIGPAIAGVSYTLWKWPQLELVNMNISLTNYYQTGFKETIGFVERRILKK